jgi:hypothetical protein
MTMPLCAEQAIRDQIAELKAKLPAIPHERAEPLHVVVSRVYKDGASHIRTEDIANDWKRVGGSIRDAVKQGGEVVLRPLYSGEQPLEVKEYPSTKRIRALEEALERLLRHSHNFGGGCSLSDDLANARAVLKPTTEGEKL